jgi:hypothetical protein
MSINDVDEDEMALMGASLTSSQWHNNNFGVS